MTTIAYDGKILAADRRSTIGGVVCSIGAKILRADVPGLGMCRVGVAGSYWDPEQALLKPDEDVTLIAVDRRGKCWVRLGDTARWAAAPRAKWAIGSGAAYAVAAMECGASAMKAVSVAARFDFYTGDGCDTLR